MSLQRRQLYAAGGKSAQDVLRLTVGLVVSRPGLAQCFNTGGALKHGSVVGEPEAKRDIMKTTVQSLFLKACKCAEPELSPAKFKTIMSDFLKRSSGMKGGNRFNKHHESADGTVTATSEHGDNAKSGDGDNSEDN